MSAPAPAPPLWGLMAEFEGPTEVVEAARRVHEAGYASAEPLEMSRQGLEQSLDKLTPLFVGGDVAL